MTPNFRAFAACMVIVSAMFAGLIVEITAIGAWITIGIAAGFAYIAAQD